MRRFLLPLLALALVGHSKPARAWSIDRELVLRVLRQAEVWSCVEQHALVPGRYVAWIEVDDRGRGRATLREVPAAISPAGRRCVTRAFDALRYPSVGEATVAYSAASPPQSRYSIAYPFHVVLPPVPWFGPNLAPPRLRPARARWIDRP